MGDVDYPELHAATCFVNGILIGWTEHPDIVIQTLRKHRASGALPFDATVAHYKGHVYLNTDPGALCRPVLNVSQLHKIPTLAQNHPDNLFECLRNHGVIQYLEKLEESEYVIATDLAAVERLNARFVEIHPSVILGLCASLIPCCDFNQSPRNTYQSAMGKQSCGTYLSNYLVRHDTVAYTLCYPQRPLVHNWVDDVTGLNALPAGQNLLVAVGCYGYNMEDSIVFNRAFIERGGGRAFVYRSHSEQESPSGNDVFKLERPEDDIAKKHGNYSKLNAEGVVPVDVAVESGDALIGKTVESYVPGSSERVKKDCSHIYRYSGRRGRSGGADNQSRWAATCPRSHAQLTAANDWRQIHLAPRAEGHHRKNLGVRGHAIQCRWHIAGHHHQPPRHPVAHDGGSSL